MQRSMWKVTARRPLTESMVMGATSWHPICLGVEGGGTQTLLGVTLCGALACHFAIIVTMPPRWTMSTMVQGGDVEDTSSPSEQVISVKAFSLLKLGGQCYPSAMISLPRQTPLVLCRVCHQCGQCSLSKMCRRRAMPEW